jgi:hypothetical protein
MGFALTDFAFNSLIINDDIDAIIQRGEERTVELNTKYEGLNLDDLITSNRTRRCSRRARTSTQG